MLGGYARIDPCTAEIRADIERAWEEAERRGAKRVARLEETWCDSRPGARFGRRLFSHGPL